MGGEGDGEKETTRERAGKRPQERGRGPLARPPKTRGSLLNRATKLHALSCHQRERVLY